MRLAVCTDCPIQGGVRRAHTARTARPALAASTELRRLPPCASVSRRRAASRVALRQVGLAVRPALDSARRRWATATRCNIFINNTRIPKGQASRNLARLILDPAQREKIVACMSRSIPFSYPFHHDQEKRYQVVRRQPIPAESMRLFSFLSRPLPWRECGTAPLLAPPAIGRTGVSWSRTANYDATWIAGDAGKRPTFIQI